MRIRFQNYLFKADKRISHHLGPHRYFVLTELEYYCNKLIIAALWLLEITKKNISCIQLSRGYNLNLFRGTLLLSEYDFTNYSVRSTKVFPLSTLFLDYKIIAQSQTMIL